MSPKTRAHLSISNGNRTETVENRSVFKPITIEEIVIFMITVFR